VDYIFAVRWMGQEYLFEFKCNNFSNLGCSGGNEYLDLGISKVIEAIRGVIKGEGKRRVR
jgi:hypothetical protein